MSTPAPRAILALREAHTLLMAAVQETPHPPGPLLHTAVEMADVVETLGDDAIEAAAEVLRDLWPPHRVRARLHEAVQPGAITVEEIEAWVAAQGRGGLEAEAALAALLDAVEAQEVALAADEAAMEAKWERTVGGERG